MNFGEAIESTKKHFPVKRAKWNNQHIYLEDQFHWSIRDGIYKGTTRVYEKVIAMYVGDIDTHRVGWVPNQEDMLAEDWEIA